MTGLSPIAASALGSLEAALSGAEASAATEPSFYEELRDGFAKDIIEQFKTGTVVLVKPVATEGANPLNAFDGVPISTTRNAVVTGFPLDKLSENILNSDRRVLIDASGFTSHNRPAGDDWLTIDAVRHNIVQLQAVPAAGPAVIYIIQARTGGPG